jgi:hypothetical protein
VTETERRLINWAISFRRRHPKATQAEFVTSALTVAKLVQMPAVGVTEATKEGMKDMQEMQQFARPGLDYAALVEDIARWARAFDDESGESAGDLFGGFQESWYGRVWRPSRARRTSTGSIAWAGCPPPWLSVGLSGSRVRPLPVRWRRG